MIFRQPAGKLIRESFRRRRSVDRRTQLYGVGAAKSGTQSIATMFDGVLRSRHEPEAAQLIGRILDRAADRIEEEAWRRYVLERDRRLYLEVDSSQLNFFLLEILVGEFEKAKFVLTIRDPYSWLDSFINHSMLGAGGAHWVSFRELRFGAGIFVHPPQERVLQERDLYTLDGYLSYWTSHNEKVLRSVPAERLMVVRTDQITQQARRIAEFAGLGPEVVRLERSHVHQNPIKQGILRQIDRDYLEEKIHKHCITLMQRFFPEIKSLADVI